LQGLNQKCSLRLSSPLRIVIFSIVVGLLAPLPALAELRFTPSLTVSERYDSNILFISGGTNKDDFVTLVSPGLSASYKGRPLEGTLSGGLSLSSYAKHSEFNYTAATGALSVDLTQLVGRLDKRARLQIADSVYYTPELPAFVSSTVGLSPFSTGIRTPLVRAFTNTSSVTGGYGLTSRVDLTAGYSYSILNFGNAIGSPAQFGVPGQNPLFRTITQSANAGPNVTLTARDTLNLQAQYQNVEFNGGAAGGFHTEGGTVGLSHSFSPQLSGKIAGGATLISPSDRIAPLASLSVSWSEKSTTTTFSFVRSVTPSFVIAATALESSIVSLAVSHKFTDRLTGAASGNYARSSSVSSATSTTSATSGSNLTFNSYGADLTLNYSFTRWLYGSFSYSHTHFSQGFSNATSSFPRDLVTLSLTATWL